MDDKPIAMGTLPLPVRRALKKLGQDISDARRRRRISATVFAERASISRVTLRKIEAGDPGVLMGNYAAALYSLGMIDRLSGLVDVRTDNVGLALEEAKLPKRIYGPRKKSATGASS